MIFDMDRHAHRAAVQTDDGALLRYADLIEKIERISQVLENRRAVVLCLCENSIGCLAGYLSFLNTGTVPIMLGSSIEPGFLHGYVRAYTPRYIWKPAGLQTDLDKYDPVFRQDDYELLTCQTDDPVSLHADLAVLATTSGSTGNKKLVRQSRSNILNNTRAIADSLNLGPDVSTITTLPMNYTFGMSVVHTHLSVGSLVHVTGHSIMQKEFWQRIRGEKIGILYGVPYTFEMLKKLKINRQDLPYLKALAQAGGRLAPDLASFFSTWCADTNKRFFTMYGQAEATTRISCFCTNERPDKIGSVGTPLAGGKVEIGGSGHETGEVIFHGGTVCMGYAEDGQDLAKGDEWNGELATGDIGYLDEDGFLFITGRKKRLVKIYGHSVSLDDMEQLMTSQGTGPFACIAAHEKIVVFHEGEEDELRLRQSLSAMLRLQNVDLNFIKLAALPRTDSGKIRYSALSAMAVPAGSVSSKSRHDQS